MDDLKMTISRSYARKVNLGNYETEDLWAMYSQEIPVEASDAERKDISDMLFDRARTDVEAQLPKGEGVSEAQLADAIVSISNKGTMPMDIYESLNQDQLKRIQEVKKAYKRRDYKEAKNV